MAHCSYSSYSLIASDLIKNWQTGEKFSPFFVTPIDPNSWAVQLTKGVGEIFVSGCLKIISRKI